MDFRKLAELVEKFDSIKLLATEIASLEGNIEIKTVDDLADFLSDELEYANY